jgi:PIN domain nuclease of toxin-antitoxin system
VTVKGYLLDTHLLIWSFNEPEKLTDHHAAFLKGDAPTFVSIATIWEIAIKESIGKLRMPQDYLAGLQSSSTGILAIRPDHTRAVRDLPLHHRDPFDRMLIAQAQMENLTILTSDRHFALYDVSLA